MSVALPVGLNYVEKSAASAEYDPETRTLIWRGLKVSTTDPLIVDAFQLAVNANDAPTQRVLHTTVAGGALNQPLVFKTGISIGVEKTAPPTDRDGVKELVINDRVKLEFAADELAPGQVIRTVEYPLVTLEQFGQRGLWLEFGPDMTFKHAVTLTVNLDGLLAPELLAAGYEPVLLYWPRLRMAGQASRN